MPKIPLTIDPTYCGDWGFWEGVRELVSNAKDAEDQDGRRMVVKHSKRSNTLTILTEDTVVNAQDLLLLGRSRGGENRRGRFGEGFVLGTLALVRKGFDLTIYNGDEVWRPGIEIADDNHPMAGAPLLTFVTRKLQSRRTAFSVEITEVTEPVWQEAEKRFLFLVPPPAAATITMDRGTVITSEEYKGKVYARGVFVRELSDLDCGYNLPEVQLDRDRRMIDEWSLKWSLAALWQEAGANIQNVPRIYQMARAGASDVKSIGYHADQHLLNAFREEFTRENGPDAVPVTSAAEVKDVEKAGATPVIVDDTLKELLAKSGLDAKKMAAERASVIDKTWLWRDLTAEEQQMWTLYGIRMAPNAVFVTFRGDALCQPMPAKDGLAVDRKLLKEPPRRIVQVIADAEAKRRGSAVLDVLLDLVTGPVETSSSEVAAPG